MAREWTHNNPHLYVQLFSDCLLVRGATNSAIYDLTRQEIIVLPTDYYPFLAGLCGLLVRDLLAKIQADINHEQLFQLMDFLYESELLSFVENPANFPAIRNAWDFPGMVQNAVIDISTISHDFSKLFIELDTLGCQHVQIRCFTDLLNVGNCRSIIENAEHKSFTSVELIMRYDAACSDSSYVSFIREHPIVTGLTVHCSPATRYLTVDEVGVNQDSYPIRRIRFTDQNIDSELHCGLITEKYLSRPTVGTFFEAQSFNGCLNRKISVDATGNIKNCPSMKDSYGNIGNSSLVSVVTEPRFTEKWGIAKDQIGVCKDCEYRYACSDCRAYIEAPQDPYSKPLKCGYDPYHGTWTNWAKDPVKQMSAKFYGMESPSIG